MINQRSVDDLTINQFQGETIRLVHDEHQIITAFRGDPDSVTETIHQVAEFDTPQEAFAWVTKQGLEYNESEFVEVYGQAEVDAWKEGTA